MDTRLLNFKNLIRFFTKGDTVSLVKDYNDLFCLFLSQLVYFSHPFITKHLTELGASRIQIIDYKGPLAVCIEFSGVTYLSVKGLSGRNRSEWPIILNFLAKDYEGTLAHGGFVNTARVLRPHIQSFTDGSKNDVILTGHSMGGAIATLSSLAVDGCKVVTFGSPRVIKRDDQGAFAKKTMFHFKVSTDFVTHLPPFMYSLPGEQLVHKKTLPIRFWDNHKLFTYGGFFEALVAGAGALRAMARRH